MGMQMYIITFKGAFTPEASRSVQHHVGKLGGLILMVTSSGPLVVIDDSQAAAVSKHPAVGFMGGVNFNPRGLAAQELQRLFAENISKQIRISGVTSPEPES